MRVHLLCALTTVPFPDGFYWLSHCVGLELNGLVPGGPVTVSNVAALRARVTQQVPALRRIRARSGGEKQQLG